MTRLGMLLAAGALLAATPSFAQTVGSCARGGGANQPQAVWVLFDLGSAQVRGDNKNKIAEAAVTAKARQVTSICVVGHTDKLGDKKLNEQLARARSKAVAAELVSAGIPANHLAVDQAAEGVGRAFHREAVRDVRAHDAQRRQAWQFVGIVLAEFGREAPHGLAGAHAQDRQALDQHMVGHDPGRAT